MIIIINRLIAKGVMKIEAYREKSENKQATWRNFIFEHQELIAALFSGALILLTWSLKSELSEIWWVILHLTAFIVGGYAKAKEGITETILHKELNVELLMILAAIGSAAIGYWTEGAILIFIFALSGALETYTLNKSNREISSLMALQPEEALLQTETGEIIVPAANLAIGDIISVRASDRIPADGQIIKGMTGIDESAITGESIPVHKKVNQEVYAGTVALDGSISVEITTPAHETLFQKIIQMVQSAQAEKSPSQLFIERFESMYVKIVLVTVAIMMFLPYLLFNWTLTESIYRAMILLVVASPCALVASILSATFSVISNSARNGVLFKGGIHAENLSYVKAVAFDKTGTLTFGKPKVTDVHFASHCDPNEIIPIVGAIENESTHPLAEALTTYSLDRDMDFQQIDVNQMKTKSGKGVTAQVNGQNWIIGNPELVGKEEAFSFLDGIAASFTAEGKTVIFVQREEEVIGLFALQDSIRPDAKQSIQALHKRGIYTIMLTGDNEGTAKAIAKEAGISDYIAECLPVEKVDQIKGLIQKYDNVAMVGDGINDAPALATANIGIAMGEGTDVALETAAIVLMKNNISIITTAIDLANKMNLVVKQHVVFSSMVILTLIVGNFFQAIDLPLGVIGHEGSTILVILNGLRLLR